MEKVPVIPQVGRGIIFLGLCAAFFTAVYKIMDNVTVHNFITSPDRLTAAFAYLIVGGWTGVVFGVAFSLLLGKRLIDPDFNGIVWNNRQMHKQALIAGGISAFSTLFTLLGTQLGDPGSLAALSSAVLIYIVIYDVLTKQVTFRSIALPLAATMLGSSLAAFNGSLTFTIFGVLFVLIISNGLQAVSEISEQKGAKASDGVNLYVWRFFWLAFLGTIIALVTSLIRGTLPLLSEAVIQALPFGPFVVVTMFFVFLGGGLKLTLKKTNANSVILLIMSSQIVLVFVATIVGNMIHPGIFGVSEMTPLLWGTRLLGAGLLIWGIIRLRKNHLAINEPIE